VASGQNQGVLREVYLDIPGSVLSDLTNNAAFPDRPSFEEVLTEAFEAPTDLLDNYGQRLQALVIPPSTGTYTFWIASDDASALYLSTDDNPLNKRSIASVSQWTNPRQWTRYPSQKSAGIALEAGRTYYLEALMKEGGGGDNLAVRWQLPNGTFEEPIPATRLRVYGLGPPQIVQQPAHASAVEGDEARFTVQVARPAGIAYQWQRNGVNLAGATEPTLVLAPVRLADQGARYRVRLSNTQGAVDSLEAVLTVTPDVTQPQALRALMSRTNVVLITFSEGVRVPTGTPTAHFAIDQGVLMQSVSAGPTSADLLLNVSGLQFGVVYTITLNGISDLAQTPNFIDPDSRITFVASEYAPAEVGGPPQPGSVVRLSNSAFVVTGGGRDIGGATDQFQFACEQRSGNFDLQTRIASVTVSDPYLHAGLMARESLEGNARFAAIFASSPQLGCFYEARDTSGRATTTVAPAGGFPVNYPQTWLRLRRLSSTLTGFASLDGETWTELGSTTFSALPTTLYFGMAVCSDTTNKVASAEFQDLGPTRSTITGSPPRIGEPLGPSSRSTGLVFSEIMYRPNPRPDGKRLEFVELYNARAIFEDLTDWRISGDIDYRFPDGFQLPAGEFVVVAAAPEDIRAVYGITNVLGPYTNNLPNAGGRIRLRNNADAIRLEVNYSSQPPWPAAADGAGPSLVLARPSYGERDPQAWAASQRRGGSPGTTDARYPSPLDAVVINEILAHTDWPVLDFIELYNRSNRDVDLSGCWLTDDPTTNRFRIPNGTMLRARSYVAFTESQLGFALSAAGETVHFLNSDASRVLDALRFGPQENGVAWGRNPNGAASFRRLQDPTPGAPNAPRRLEDIVINEIMYNPISGDDNDEYIELHHRGSQPLDLAGWRLRGGIDFKFPAGASIPSGGYVVVGRNAAQLRTNYAPLNAANTFGNYSGVLRNSGDQVVLTKPETILSTNLVGEVSTNLVDIAIAEVAYQTGGRWGTWSDGGGSSLELTDPLADPQLPSNWADSDETRKAPWTPVEFTGLLDNGNSQYPPNRFHILMQGAGECLVDDLEIFRAGSTNLLTNGGFESGATGWAMNGNHSTSSLESGGAASGVQCLRVRAQGDGDTGINSIRSNLGAGLTTGATVTLRAKVRWLAGWPEVLFRVRGNGVEMPARMAVPVGLGTPGQPNSRALANAGPAVTEVNHLPTLPRASQAVVVTCRASDPHGIGSLNLRFRVDPAATFSTVPMRDDGLSGDEIAGDGLYSATISGRSSGTLIAFRIEATDAGAPAASSVFPASVPAQECLIRWDEPVPWGTFAHYHLWSTRATEDARNRTVALNNTWRDATLVYGDSRVIYNVGFRDKGSPYHGGGGDFAVTVSPDDLLLGAKDRVFGSTGNGGSEETNLRGQVANWFAQRMGIPYLHCHYMQLYRNGNQFRNIMEDLEQPNNNYAEAWFPQAGEGELYKIAVWFEFQDDNRSFGATSATMERFLSQGRPKLARYRWIFQNRPRLPTANNYTNIFELADAANDRTTNYVSRVLTLADIDQWMRVFAFNRVMGNWDSWSYSVGQNMFLFRQPGERWVLMPWDIDFVLGLGGGTSEGLWGGQDGVINRMYDAPAFRRMLWRAYQETAQGPMLAQNFGPQVDARRAVLLKNGITGSANPNAIYSYVNGRRNYLLNQLKANDAAAFALTTNSGNDYNSGTPTTVLTGTAPFVVADIEVNGVPYPVTWTDVKTFAIQVPLTARTNRLVISGKDRFGQPIAAATDTITVAYTGPIAQPENFVVLNELMYNPPSTGASFLELFNRSTTTPFDLSGFRVNGIGYTFPAGAILAQNGYLVLAKDRAAFALAYGGSLPVFDEFPGSLDNGGERISLLRPDAATQTERVISDVRYSNRLPWPTNADGFGSSLQLIDPAQDVFRAGNWTATETNEVNRATPARANAVRQNLSPFPALWINEVQPNNVTGPKDAAGEREPWIELYNAGSTSVDLTGLYLTDSYTHLTRWSFPSGTVLGARQHMIVWADGEPHESTAGAPHANFRLNPTNGAVALVRLQGSPPAPGVIDYLDYAQMAPDHSYGSVPDGEPRTRRALHRITPGAPNDGTSPRLSVTINEIMAINTSTLADPADGDFEDWFELHNAATTPADLSGFTLTDNPTNATQFVIPPGTIVPPDGHLLVWADEETAQNRPGQDLHVNFKLTSAGETLALFAPDKTLVDQVSFGILTNDVSVGRYPDGGDLPLVTFETPTPRQPNVLAGANRPPVITPPGSRTVTELSRLTVGVSASDPDPGQTLRFSLTADAPEGAVIDPLTGRFEWIPTEAQGPGSYVITVRVTDDGAPPRSASGTLTIQVLELNQRPTLEPVPDQVIDEGSLWRWLLQGADPDLPANVLTYTLGPGAPAGLSLDVATGELLWEPAEEQGPGVHPVTVQVADNGPASLVATRSFTLTVREINNPPVMDQIQAQAAQELSLFAFTVQAVDPDDPPSPLRYSFDQAPAGATIDPASGVILWTPTEDEGPTNAIFIVRATELVPPALSVSRTFSVEVAEANQRPILTAPQDAALNAGDVLAFVVTAQDLDRPPQELSFQLEPGAPTDASIDPQTGLFRWPVSPDDHGGTYRIGVRVTDDGPGALSDVKSFQVTVRARFSLVINEIMYRSAVAGADYVEIFNVSSNIAYDLGGLVLASETLQYQFPPLTLLSPRHYLSVTGNLTAFRNVYGASLRAVGPWSGEIAPAGTLRLLRPASANATETVLDTVTYDHAAPWPLAANGAGASLQLIDANRDNDRIGNWSATPAYTGPTQFITLTNQWRYYQAGPLTGTAWTQAAFNDSSWSAGRAALVVEDAALPVAKNTLLTIGRTTYYFRARFTLPAVPQGATLKLITLLDDGAVFYLNGQEIYRVNLPAGAITPTTAAIEVVPDATLAGPFFLPGEALVAGENLLAVEVHQQNASSSDLVMACSLDLDAGAATAFTPSAPNNVAASLPELPSLRLNEVVARNANGRIDQAGDADPWIEIVNTGPGLVTFDGLYLSDDVSAPAKWPFPDGLSLSPGGFLIVVADGEITESSLTEPHTSFRLPSEVGAPWRVLLAKGAEPRPILLDYLAGQVTGDDAAYGLVNDGDPSARGPLGQPTPGAPNVAQTPEVGLIAIGLSAVGEPIITWASSVGARYLVEGKDNLPELAWTTLREMTATGPTSTFVDTTMVARPQRYYRIRLLP
jgi:hypothetical protein